jgi:hypothetical protein
MPSRIVREGILTSERINSLSANAELFYRRLMSVVDDYGRFSANLTLLRASCYPLKLDSVKEDSISKHLAECVDARLVVLYTVADKALLELQDFRQQVRAKESKYPSPDLSMRSTCVANAEQVQTNVHLDVVVDVIEDVGVKPRTRRQPKTQMPEDFAISERVRRWAAEKGYSQLDEHLESFKRKAAAKSYEYASWDDAFMEAIRCDWAGLRVPGRGGNGAPIGGQSRRSKDEALRNPMTAAQEKRIDADNRLRLGLITKEQHALELAA